MTSENQNDFAREFMQGAWASFILWAYDQPDLIAQFEAQTGHKFLPAPKSVVEAAIDQATGADDANAEAFTRWVTERHWGEEYAPEVYQKIRKAERDMAAKIDAARTPAGGWTRKGLLTLGVPWPPKTGWKKRLIADAGRRAAESLK